MYGFQNHPGIERSDISAELKEETDVVSMQELLQITYQMEEMQ